MILKIIFSLFFLNSTCGVCLQGIKMTTVEETYEGEITRRKFKRTSLKIEEVGYV